MEDDITAQICDEFRSALRGILRNEMQRLYEVYSDAYAQLRERLAEAFVSVVIDMICQWKVEFIEDEKVSATLFVDDNEPTVIE